MRIILRFILVLAACIGARAAGGAEARLTFVQVVGDADGGSVKNQHIGPVTAKGDYVYAAVHYSGQIRCYKRDLTSGKLTFVSDFNFEKRDLSPDSLVWANGRLYCHAGAGHETGDGDSRGLHWLEADPHSGALTEKGSVAIPICSGLAASRDGKFLYLLARQRHTVIRYRIEPDGRPEKLDETAFKDADGDVGYLTLTGDGGALLGKWGGAPYVLGCMAVRPDGSLQYQGRTILDKLTEGIHWPQGKWGYGWGSGFACSPDGQACYAEFCTYGGNDERMALFARDPKTNAITFKGRLEAKTGAEMVRLMDCAFEADGASGYYVSGTETCGNVVGWFTRDPKSGELTFGGIVKQTKGKGPSCLFHDAEHGFVYAGTWNSQQLFVMKTHPGGK